MEAATPAPDSDWGVGICDLNVAQLEKQLQKLETGERSHKGEACAIAAGNPAAGKVRGRNRMARMHTPMMPCGEEGHRNLDS